MKKNILFSIICITLLYFFLNFQRTAIPGSIFNELQQGLEVPSAKYVTAIGAAFMYIYSFGQLLSGLLADRYGGFRTILAGSALFTLGCVGAPFTSNIWVMYLLRALTGLGASCIYISMIQVLSQHCKTNFTVIFGFVMCFGYAGSIAAGSPFVASVHAVGWRTSLAIIGFTILAIWVLFTLIYKSLPKQPVNPVPLRIKPIVDVFRRDQNIRFCLFMCINWGLYYTFLTVIGKKFLEDYCQMSAMSAANVTTAMAALAAGFNFFSGVLSRLANNRRKPFLAGGAFLAFACNIIIFLCLLAQFRHWVLTIPLFLITLTANMSPVQVAFTKEVNPPDQSGTALATVNFAAYFCVAIVSCIAGLLLEVFPPEIINDVKIYGVNSYRLYFAFASAALLPGALCAFGLKESSFLSQNRQQKN